MADHDWRKIMHEHVDDEVEYHVHLAGFWIGAMAGSVGTIILCLLIGLAYNDWRLP